MERKTKKIKKKGDTCRDCWTKRFHKELCKQWETEQEEAKPAKTISLSAFLNRETESRELVIKNMREVFANIYDEISAIEHLAGDLYMDRYDKDKED